MNTVAPSVPGRHGKLRYAVSGHAYRWLANLAAAVAIVYLLAPIAMMIVLSFNHIEGRFDYVWNEFSIDAWRHPFVIPGLLPALGLSLLLACVVAPIATAIGTLLGYAQVKFEFPGKRVLDIILLMTIATPEVVVGSSLLNFFLDARVPTGFGTLVIAHIMFDIAFTAIVVKSRLRTFDFAVEQAAMDLGARGVRVFLKITLPIILPAVIMAGVLAFMLSLDDFIISNFVSGATVTFPLFVWGTARIAMPPQIYVVGTMMFVSLAVVVVGLMTIAGLRQRRHRAALAEAA